MGKKAKKLSTSMIIYCSVLALALCLVLGILGYWIYYQKSMESYRTYLESTLNIVDSMIDSDDMRECIETLIPSETYEQTQEDINAVKSSTIVEYLYIVVPLDENDMSNMIYVSAAYTEQEAIEEPETLVKLGEEVQEDAFTEDMLEILNDVMFHNAGVSYMSYNASFGYMLTGVKPVTDSEGNVVCLICVDFNMDDIYATMYDYILGVVIGGAITMIIMLLIIIGNINRSVVRPIRQMADAAGDFVAQSHASTDPSTLEWKAVEVKRNDEIGVLNDSITNMMSDTVDYMKNLTKVTAERERMSAELSVATQIQESMIPCTYPAFPDRPEFEIYGRVRSTSQMGGAFFDYFFVDKNHFGFYIGEIDGTGIPAALLMVIARTMIKNYAQLGYSVDKVLSETNNQLAGSNEATGMKITAFMGIIDLETGVLSYVNAGHKAPYLKRSGGDFEPLASKGCFALGSMAGVPYWSQTVDLVQGDMLFMYTSGVTEAVDRKGDAYSEIRLLGDLNGLVGKEYAIEKLEQRMEDAVDTFCDGAELEDDIAMLIFRYFW